MSTSIVLPSNWSTQLTDPVCDFLRDHGVSPDLDTICSFVPTTVGDPAFDPEIIAASADDIQTTPAVQTGHPLLDRSVKVGLVCIDATFQGDHPKYGVKHYAEERHDGFPPTIIAAVDALTAWGLYPRAAQLFRYWLAHFILENGTICYYGPSVSEYGQLLHTAMLLYERAGGTGWWADGQAALTRLADYALERCAQAQATGDLVPGIPEADISDADPNNLSDVAHCQRNRYFHNNAWLARGLMRWADLVEQTECTPRHSARIVRQMAHDLAHRTLDAIRSSWPSTATHWWLPPQLESADSPDTLTSSTYASYTNYRYWPELLASGLLPMEMAHRLVETRLRYGGQFCGMTRFEDRLDDWPLADYLHGLWQLGRRDDFLISLYGHVACHQASGHLTAYEQISLPTSHELAPYCLPCQLVAARAARVLQ